MDKEPRLVTLDEAAEVSGLSIEALRKRITRGRLSAVKGNDGRPRVRLDNLPKKGGRSSDATVRLSGRPEKESGLSQALSLLAEQLAAVRTDVERERTGRLQAEQGRDAAVSALQEAVSRLGSQIERERERSERAESAHREAAAEVRSLRAELEVTRSANRGAALAVPAVLGFLARVAGAFRSR